MTGTHVRPATPADGPTLRALQSALDAPAPALLEAALDSGPPTCLVAVEAPDDDGPPVGYALALGGEDWYLAELVVAPDHRRRGHASALVAALAERCEGRLRVTVRADDERARSFYAARGFGAVERLAGFYDLPDGSRDGIAMVRPADDAPEEASGGEPDESGE